MAKDTSILFQEPHWLTTCAVEKAYLEFQWLGNLLGSLEQDKLMVSVTRWPNILHRVTDVTSTRQTSQVKQLQILDSRRNASQMQSRL